MKVICLENIHLKRSRKLISLPVSLNKLHLIHLRSNQFAFEVNKENSDSLQLIELKCTGVPWLTACGDKIYQSEFRKAFERFFTDKQIMHLFRMFDKDNNGCISKSV